MGILGYRATSLSGLKLIADDAAKERRRREPKKNLEEPPRE
jgi:hypothetical protein